MWRSDSPFRIERSQCVYTAATLKQLLSENRSFTIRHRHYLQLYLTTRCLISHYSSLLPPSQLLPSLPNPHGPRRVCFQVPNYHGRKMWRGRHSLLFQSSHIIFGTPDGHRGRYRLRSPYQRNYGENFITHASCILYDCRSSKYMTKRNRNTVFIDIAHAIWTASHAMVPRRVR